MRSIRLSLVLYFLGLLTLGLGGASIFAYQMAHQTLQEKKAASEKLIQAQFEDNCAKEYQRFDDELRSQAQTLARVIQFPIDWNPNIRRYHVLGLLTSQTVPGGYVLAYVWAAQGVRSTLSSEMSRPFMPAISLDEDELFADSPEIAPEYFQIDSGWGSTYRSESLLGRTLPLDQKSFARNQVLYWEFDDLEIEPGLRVRRVILKTQAARLIPIRFPSPMDPPIWRGPHSFGPTPGMPGNPPRNSDSGSRKGPPPDFNSRSSRTFDRPPIFIHVANNVQYRDAALDPFREQRDSALADLAAETRTSLTTLRDRLLAVAFGTFAAMMLGTWWLIWFGLLPLRRISDAVSKISPRDFRLPLNEHTLPREVKPIVERLAGTLSMLERAFAREKQATADLSHELRTPLAALLTTTDIALRKPRSGEEYRELLQDCRLSAQHINNVIERLLTLARLDAGVENVRTQPFDAAQVADQCAAVVRPLVEARGLHFTMHRKGPIPLIADPDKLREVLTNLLHNAIQYNRPEGSIDLSIQRENGSLCFAVHDTGIGINPEQKEHLFERFYRADTSRGGDGLHAGLGLSIVKEYVDLMGGHVEVESTPGQGSTFRVQLPVKANGEIGTTGNIGH